MNDLLDHAVRSSLLDYLDKNVILILRDGRKLVGYFRSFDQYSNILMEEVVERKVFEENFADLYMGVFIVRGENVVFIGELDEDTWGIGSNLREVTMEELLTMISEDTVKNAGVAKVRRFIDVDDDFPLF